MCVCVCGMWKTKRAAFCYFEGGTSLVVLGVFYVSCECCVCALGPGPTVDTQFSVLFSLVCCRWIKHFHGLWADSERVSEPRATFVSNVSCTRRVQRRVTLRMLDVFLKCVFMRCTMAANDNTRAGMRLIVCVCVFVCTCMMYACARLLFATEMWHSKNPFHCCLQIIDVDCLNEMFAVHYLLLLLFAQHKFHQTL